MQFIKVNRDHPSRHQVEAYIRDVYADEYNAGLTEFPDLLVALVDDESEIVCAAGLRFEEDGFFSEGYLSKPIDRLLDPIWASPVKRDQIGEISSLVGTKPGASLLLMKNIVELFRDKSVPWAFFTATERLRAILRRSGVPALDIESANIDCVENPEQWGTYYDTNPRVAAVHDSMLSIMPPAVSYPAQGVGAAVSA